MLVLCVIIDLKIDKLNMASCKTKRSITLYLELSENEVQSDHI